MNTVFTRYIVALLAILVSVLWWLKILPPLAAPWSLFVPVLLGVGAFYIILSTTLTVWYVNAFTERVPSRWREIVQLSRKYRTCDYI